MRVLLTGGYGFIGAWIIRNLLKQLGFEEVDDASDGTAALARLKGRKYGLVISDWNMEPMTGYDLLKDIELPWPVAEVAWQHHERMDGSGYPRGLQADAIILEARIVMVADVVESMASRRPYRHGLGIDRALAEIERGGGSVYDPVVADACLRLFREQAYAIPE